MDGGRAMSIRRSVGRAAFAGGLLLAGATAARAQTVIFSEPFAADLGDMTATNDGNGSNAWAFDSTCPATALAGHSVAGTAHWINPTTCLDYGNQGSSDLLRSAQLDIADCRGGIELRFNYYLDFQEDASWDRARAVVSLDASTDVVVAANLDEGESEQLERPAGGGGGNPPALLELVNDATWHSIAALVPGSESAATAQLVFVGETIDGIANGGEGFLVDDVEVTCRPAAYEIPTLGGAGFAALAALLALAAVVALARRRRTA